MHLFHYHLVTSKVREVEARYIGKLGFNLIARHGRVGEDLTSYESGLSWSELDAFGFKASTDFRDGLRRTIDWYRTCTSASSTAPTGPTRQPPVSF